MQKINNIGVLGILAGVVTVIANVLLNAPGKKQRGFFNKIDLITALSTGVFNTHVLIKTGRKNSYLKGMAMGLGNWLLYHGMFKSKKKGKNFGDTVDYLNLLRHIIAGSLSALFVSRMGDDYLFPYEPPKASQPSIVDKYAYSSQIIQDKLAQLKNHAQGERELEEKVS